MSSRRQASDGDLDPETVVAALYRIFFGREGDPEGIAHHAALLREGTQIEDLARKFLFSEEFAIKGGAGGFALRQDLAEPTDGAGHPLAAWPSLHTASNSPYYSFRNLFRPLMLIIETVNICNNDCVICPYSLQTREKQTMPLDLFEKVVGDYAAIGGGQLSLTPVVGEMFLDKKLGDRLDVLRRHPAITAVSATTNAGMAYLYGDEELRSLLARFTRVKISVYGFDDDEFRAMTRTDSFEATTREIVRLVRLAPPGVVKIGLRNLKARSDAEIGAWLGDLARRAGAPAPEIVSNADAYSNWSVLDTTKPLPFDGKWKKARLNDRQCLVPLIAAQVFSDGRVSFCACADFDADGELLLGNVADTSLGDMIGSPKYLGLWDWARRGIPGFCRTCSYHTPIAVMNERPWAFADPIRFIGG